MQGALSVFEEGAGCDVEFAGNENRECIAIECRSDDKRDCEQV